MTDYRSQQMTFHQRFQHRLAGLLDPDSDQDLSMWFISSMAAFMVIYVTIGFWMVVMPASALVALANLRADRQG